jgi:hypothetical protein
VLPRSVGQHGVVICHVDAAVHGTHGVLIALRPGRGNPATARLLVIMPVTCRGNCN